MVRIAIVQAPPVVLDRPRSLARVVEHIERASAEGARLVVFSEAYVPGYPDWLWRLRPYPDAQLRSATLATGNAPGTSARSDAGRA